jgi:hypothetical protein
MTTPPAINGSASVAEKDSPAWEVFVESAVVVRTRIGVPSASRITGFGAGGGGCTAAEPAASAFVAGEFGAPLEEGVSPEDSEALGVPLHPARTTTAANVELHLNNCWYLTLPPIRVLWASKQPKSQILANQEYHRRSDFSFQLSREFLPVLM